MSIFKNGFPVLCIFGYILGCIFLLVYSYTQVDLNLTLNQSPMWLPIQDALREIGYFNRTLSTSIYIVILILLFSSYIGFLRLAALKQIAEKTLLTVVLIVTLILTFSYNAFSYDIFNYIFDAKIVTFYNDNPYLQKALDYPDDPMVSFMRWTHRTYPYGPVWIGITVPISFVGLQYFLPTFFLFKIFTGLSFIGLVYSIRGIMRMLNTGRVALAVAFFGLNPLVVIECIVSSHNDTVMMFLMVLSYLLLFHNRNISSITSFLLSIGVKFASGFAFPIYLYSVFKKDYRGEKFILHTLFLMGVAVVTASVLMQFQPWYLLWVLPFAALLVNRSYVVISGVLISFFGLIQYIPFLFLGGYEPPVPMILQTLTLTSVFVSIFVSMVYEITKRVQPKRI